MEEGAEPAEPVDLGASGRGVRATRLQNRFMAREYVTLREEPGGAGPGTAAGTLAAVPTLSAGYVCPATAATELLAHQMVSHSVPARAAAERRGGASASASQGDGWDGKDRVGVGVVS